MIALGIDFEMVWTPSRIGPVKSAFLKGNPQWNDPAFVPKKIGAFQGTKGFNGLNSCAYSVPIPTERALRGAFAQGRQNTEQ